MKKHFSVIKGEGDNINIFLPGTGWSGDFGMPIAEHLSEEFTTHMIDLPGIGRSKGLEGVIKLKDIANWMNEYIEENNFLTKVNITGHSLGGIIGLAFAFYYPEKVNRIVLMDIGYSKIDRFPTQMMGSGGYFLPIISALHRVFGPKVLGKESVEDQKQATKVMDEEMINDKIDKLELEDSQFIRKALHDQQQTSISGINLLLAAYRSNLPKLVKDLEIPCLILYGNRINKSKRMTKRIKKQINKVEKGANIKTQELNGGHYAHVTDLRAVNDISSFFLKKHSILRSTNKFKVKNT